MNAAKIFALALIAAGVLGLVYGSFTYTKDTHEANVGPINFSIKDKETVNIPIWAGVVAVAIGGGLLFLAGKRS
jgi:TRAP-type C4-dicarboxylate transport system permease small subunit